MTEDDESICGLCGEPGAEKFHHPCHWPGERIPDGPFVHASCENEECERAYQEFKARVGDEGIREFLRP